MNRYNADVTRGQLPSNSTIATGFKHLNDAKDCIGLPTTGINRISTKYPLFKPTFDQNIEKTTNVIFFMVSLCITLQDQIPGISPCRTIVTRRMSEEN